MEADPKLEIIEPPERLCEHCSCMNDEQPCCYCGAYDDDPEIYDQETPDG